MLAARCPSCGRPGPLRLDQPNRFTCSCGYDGAPPRELAGRIQAAARILVEQDATYRQLSTLQRRVLSSGLFASAVYLIVLGIALLPFSLCFVLLLSQRGPTNVFLIALFGTPLLVIALFGGSGLLFMRSRLGRARQALRAFPAAAPGEPARCHLCGAPVTPLEDHAFVRCGHCGADNLVDVATVQALDARRDLVLDGFEAEVGRRATIGRQAFRSAVRGVLASILLALPVAVCVGFVVFAALRQIETEIYDELEYAVVANGGGRRCVVRVRDAGSGTVTLAPPGDPYGEDEDRPRAEVPTFGASEIGEGLRVMTLDNRDHGDAWRVVRVFGTAGTVENLAVIRAERDDFERTERLGELCLLAGEPSPAPPIH